jgi:hypothetical protein
MPHMKTRLMWLIWVCFVMRGLFYSVLFPIWEGYDEHAHFAFIQHVVFPGGLPGLRDPVSKEIDESLKLVPVPWEIRGWSRDFVPHDAFWKMPESEQTRRQNALKSLAPELSREPGGKWLNIYEAKQPPLYYWIFSVPMRLSWNLSLPARVLLLRFLAVLLTSILVPLGFRIAALVLNDRKVALMAIALAAAMPELIIDIARVGNECLGVVVYCLVLYFALQVASSPGQTGNALLLGVSLGLGLLTKSYFLTALPVAVLLVIFAVYRRGKRGVLNALIVCAVPVAISGWWYWRNHALGEWSGAPLSRLLPNVWRVNWISSVDTILLSHIWFGNWSFLGLRSWMYHVMGLIFAAACAGLLVLAFRRIRARSAPYFLADWQGVGVLAAFYISYVAGLFYFVLVTYTYTGIWGIPGWYMYCLVVAEVLLLASGLFALIPRHVAPWVMPSVTVLFCILDLYATHFILVPYYTGLISHKQTSALPAFHVERLLEFGTALHRLQVNRPEGITSAAIVMFWLLYIVATFVLATVSIRLARNSRNDESSHG